MNTTVDYSQITYALDAVVPHNDEAYETLDAIVTELVKARIDGTNLITRDAAQLILGQHGYDLDTLVPTSDSDSEASFAGATLEEAA